jgi:hypothetical protein
MRPPSVRGRAAAESTRRGCRSYGLLVQAYTDYQPIRQQIVNAPGDPRSNGTQQLYFDQQWGANSIFFNLDDRSYRDIRMKTTGGADDTGPRADNPARTMLGATELAWVEQGLLAAQNDGTLWKFVAVSSPIDQIGPIGGSFTINNSGDPNTTQPGYTSTESDGGKSWMGEYRPERNALLKFIADNHIDHVVFLSTDDHQVRVSELGYFTQFTTNSLGYQAPVQSSYTRVPGVFEIVAGPIGATGPDTITDHSIANIQALAQNFASQQQALGIDPIGLDASFPGLTNVSREGDPTAGTSPKPFDFYSPDTFNYVAMNLSADGSTFTVTVDGINSYATNTFPQPGSSNPVRQILQFQVSLAPVSVAVSPATAIAGGTTTLTATLTDAHTGAPLANSTLTFLLNGNVVGTATTDSSGKATLSNVSVAGLLPGYYAGAVTVRFAGDAGHLPGGGAGSLNVLPARDVTDQVHVRRNGPVMGPKDGTYRADLTITNAVRNPTLNGLFAIQLNNLTQGVTLQAATVTVGGVTYNLTITYSAAGDPIINIPAAVASALSPGQSLPTISLVFSNPGNKHFDFDIAVFLDPLDG